LEKASLEELINAPKMTFKSAQSVYDFFHSESK